MPGNVAFPVVPGSTATVEVLLVRGCGFVLRCGEGSEAVIVPAHLGSVDPLPGYERAIGAQLAGEVHAGDSMQITWLGVDPANGAAQIALMGRTGRAVERRLVDEGWAIPSPEAWAVSHCRDRFTTSVVTAAQGQKGGWGDPTVRPELIERTQAEIGSFKHLLKPSFIDAHPGLGGIVLLAVLIGVSVLMARENRAVAEDLAERKSGLPGRFGRWATDLHLRWFRPLPPRRSKPKQDPPA